MACTGGVFSTYIREKKIFLFDSFGFEGFKEFIMDDDRKTLNKILFGIEKFFKKDNKFTLVIVNNYNSRFIASDV